MRYVTAARIREIDRLAQERYKIPSLILMENAGIAATDEILSFFSQQPRRLSRVAVFCGKGNNGGDGFVVARQLAVRGIGVTVFLMARARAVRKADPAVNQRPLGPCGVRIVEVADGKVLERIRRRFVFDAVIDAIFGTGFRGALPPLVAHSVQFLNSCSIPVFALDIPTGLDATTGKVTGVCVRAVRTITFGLPKTGFIKGDGSRYVGKVVVRNIGYPPALLR